ncbi:SDR family oxidoreductase [Fictibacillus barbaricus]|uniref:NAD(P)-dependent dehydrogenase (Short-subunit alcohol dehydrogenase family) n=1 Tax=Fictibacillus barbaricus TaxID=182136 RepID=A0ABU1TWE1_9BACL|nr:SDR family oxidoreductase [Fictibacillus barbaricus]MDR7071518.1 NAD(P)-dependent dehydrogenase (short-subunit alcohol dehydrogenase family) [Fictibacillus barbaricus]
MENKIVFITGGNSGIGKATALELAKNGMTVVILSRSEERGKEAVEIIKQETGNNNIHLIVADLSSQLQVKKAAEEFKQKFSKLDVLINNAAVFLPKRSVTEDGIETTFATNYLSHFLLSHLLLDSLEASGEGRIINVASKHNGIKMNFDDLMVERNYAFYKAVGPTKLGLILFTKELAKRLKGRPITVNSLHPGIIKSNIMHQLPWLLRSIFGVMSSKTENGAVTPVYLATSPIVKGISGEYFEKCKAVQTLPNANDPDTAERLWNVSMSLLRPEVKDHNFSKTELLSSVL